jgi:hypothetical protein
MTAHSMHGNMIKEDPDGINQLGGLDKNGSQRRTLVGLTMNVW